MKLKMIVPSLLLCVIPLISQHVLASEVIGQVDLTKVTLFLKGADLHTISGYSNNNILMLKKRNISAQYCYISMPKLDSNAFLQVQISDWDKLELLPDKSTVFYVDNYIGEGFIITPGIKNTLNISLACDKEIIIKRNQDLNETSNPSFFGNDISQKFAYTINVRNTKNVSINMAIYDQLPVIQNKTISIADAKYSGADYQKDTGLLTWNVNLKVKEVK